MKQLASVGIEPEPLDYESNTLPTEPHETHTSVCVRLPQMAMLKIYPNMTLAVEQDIKPEL